MSFPEFPCITIAAINGHAFAAGAMVALAHDFRVMRNDRGFFCLPEVDIGMTFTDSMESVIKSRLSKATAEVTAARLFYPSKVVSTSFPTQSQLSPPNSAAGTLPSTVTTNASGVATFSLTYTKSNAAYIVDRIRAQQPARAQPGRPQ